MSTGTDSFATKKLKSGKTLIGDITYDSSDNSYYYDIYIFLDDEIDNILYSSKHFDADIYDEKDVTKIATKKFNRYFKIKNKKQRKTK
jgi:hypothetical protein